MKIQKIVLTVVLLLSMVLSACQPAPVTPEPVTPETEPDLYPVEEQTMPEDLTQAEDTYPILDENKDTDGAVGNSAYISDPKASAEELQKLAHASNQFAIDLYQRLVDKEGNLIYSPFSIYQALLMTYAGAEGETAQQMMDVLGVTDNNEIHNVMNALKLTLQAEPTYTIEGMQPLIFNIANALWVQKDFHFEQTFLDKLMANYAAGLALVDFNKPDEARDLINHWVEVRTNEKIKELIPTGMLNEMTRLVLTNAVYFKGAWTNRFDPARNTQEEFTSLDGAISKVEMMNNSFTGAAFVEKDYSVVSLPYEGGNFAMMAVLPEDFASFQTTMNADLLNEILEKLTESHTMVHLTMPKFSFESSIDLGETLPAMGMSDAFDINNADFSGMTGGKDLYISDVVHQAFIDVNEDGTEAAAATMVSMAPTSMPGEAITLRLDRPFIYLIYNTQTNAVVFMGHVVAP
ncbi:MAG TPA: serpin family protein [Anaerolineaceae bacterium]|nr:serpin family protein [Anaerolineaceae bacterium]